MFLPEIVDGEDKSSELVNCIRNHYRHVRKWAKKSETNCFRLYDRALAKYPFAVDYYDGRCLVSYFAKGDEEIPHEVIQEAVEKVIGPASFFWRTRKPTRQYEKQSDANAFFSVLEYGAKFRVNLTDYLDTGLFLDHRETRRLVASQARGKRLLNLFSYTGAFSVQAALHGATFTKSVDMSNTYTDWCRDNFRLNKLTGHEMVRADVLKFLPAETATYDLIVIDPPTLSRSKKMEGLFDIQEDYPGLIHHALRLLNPGGEIYFSTNLRSFRFDPTLFPNAVIRDISKKTLPIDFADPLIHKCWKIYVPTHNLSGHESVRER